MSYCFPLQYRYNCGNRWYQDTRHCFLALFLKLRTPILLRTGLQSCKLGLTAPWCKSTPVQLSTYPTFSMGEDAQLCENLARALGFDDSDGFQSSTPYITHILSQWPGRAPKSAYIDLFIRVVEAFTSKIHGSQFFFFSSRQSINDLMRAH